MTTTDPGVSPSPQTTSDAEKADALARLLLEVMDRVQAEDAAARKTA